MATPACRETFLGHSFYIYHRNNQWQYSSCSIKISDKFLLIFYGFSIATFYAKLEQQHIIELLDAASKGNEKVSIRMNTKFILDLQGSCLRNIQAP